MQAEQDASVLEKETSFRDVCLDPDNLLNPQVKKAFERTNAEFSQVFQSDLPRYNGFYGKVEASINVPKGLPQSSRLKHCPWYPKKMLLELQAKMDELEAKGALARPQDHDINVEAVSPS